MTCSCGNEKCTFEYPGTSVKTTITFSIQRRPKNSPHWFKSSANNMDEETARATLAQWREEYSLGVDYRVVRHTEEVLSW